MNPSQFIQKWSRNTRHERSAAQEHFIDLCRLIEHRTPNEDADGTDFAFEKGVTRRRGNRDGQGWADVWKREHFGWEYKGKHKDLEAAFEQLKQYKEDLLEPKLLVVCDMEKLSVHTNFRDTPSQRTDVQLNELDQPLVLEQLRWIFFEPERFRPGVTIEEITQRAAKKLGSVAKSMYRRGLEPLRVARFLNRVVFCFFSEDVGLLPREIFTNIVEKNRYNPTRLARRIEQLFRAMTTGGDFDEHEIRRFNGNLFSDEEVLIFEQKEIEIVREACGFNWNALNPSIMGTLFESALDESQERAQLGAHYTKQSDIEALVKPVVMAPLEDEWRQIRARFETDEDETYNEREHDSCQIDGKEIQDFLARLGAIRVLDPACGSGNFLYVSLQLMKDLEKSVHRFATDRDLGDFTTIVRPEQFLGLEVNANAMDLAQTTLWIGFLQWTFNNGYAFPSDPVLHNTDNFRNVDAILDRSGEQPQEAVWPPADFIVGNPPFLGDKMMRAELGDDYVKTLRKLYENRVPGAADLCCYWFEKARAQIENGQTKRAGLIATQGIRGGANREVLKRIKESGDIFFALSDHKWTLKGAAVHVSIVGFDDGSQTNRVLDGREVPIINANLSSQTDLTQARPIAANAGICFLGVMKGGDFNIEEKLALSLLQMPNVHGRPNSDVLRPRVTAEALVRRTGSDWLIDFNGHDLDEAALYEMPYGYIETNVKPVRLKNRRSRMAERWWLHGENRPGMRRALHGLKRFIVTPEVSKHRIFDWLDSPFVADHQLRAFARDDDYFFGVLHSRLHEVWARAQGTQLRERESGFRYTPTSCFETFPFPRPTDEQRAAIAEAARVLDERRRNWLHPPEWMREEILEFRGSIDGAWRRFVTDADSNSIGTVRYPRLVPRDPNMTVYDLRPNNSGEWTTRAVKLSDALPHRTLTNLYNARPQWLANLHRVLDCAVCDAYNWPHDLSDEEILAKLLALNAARVA